MTDDWRSAVSFTDRFEFISQIIFAYGVAHPDSASDASQHARKAEDDALKQATSLADYNTKCESIIHELQSSVSAPLVAQDTPTAASVAAQVISKSVNSQKFGRWKDTHYYRSGLFSGIYVSKSIDRNSDSDFEKADEYVALKATNLSAAKPPHNPTREVRILRATSLGQGIIPLLESFHDGAGHLVIVMPFLPITLEDIIRANAPFTDSLKGVIADLFKALAHVHKLGIIHRDIKPSNILLTSLTGPAYLSDFGIAWIPSDPDSEPVDQKFTDVATTCYRPPEVLFGSRTYGTEFDLWSAGCVLSEVLVGKELFDSGDVGSDLTLVMSVFESLGTPNESVWPELKDIPDWGKIPFRKMEAKSWDKLLPNVNETGRDLISQLVRYSGSQRLKAEQVLEHPFFDN